MTLYEIAALVVFLAASLLRCALSLYVIYQVTRLAIAITREYLRDRAKERNRKHYPPVKTPLGEFTFDGDEWRRESFVGERIFVISLPDSDGRPDPKLLGYMVDHRDELAAMEQAARNAVDHLTERHELAGLSDPVAGDLCLHFSYDEEYWGETVFVDMQGLTVVGWVICD